MANTVKMKQSSVAGKAPTTTDLSLGELAVNTTDGKLYLKKNVSGTESIVEVGAGGSGTVTSVSGTSPISVASGTTTPAISISAATTSAAGSMSATDKAKLDGIASGATANTGTVTSVGVTVPTGLSVSGTPVTSSGTIAISLTSGYSIPTTSSQTNWDSAYTQRLQWDGGSTNLVASTARTNLGLGTAATMTGPSGTIVGTTDTQTLINKTLTGYTETVYSLTGTAISPANGTIQYKTLSANTTFTESLADGQSVTLMLNPGTYTATWPTTTWIGSAASTAPTLVASVYNCITFFQIAGTLYGKYEGRV